MLDIVDGGSGSGRVDSIVGVVGVDGGGGHGHGGDGDCRCCRQARRVVKRSSAVRSGRRMGIAGEDSVRHLRERGGREKLETVLVSYSGSAEIHAPFWQPDDRKKEGPKERIEEGRKEQRED